MHRVGVGEHAGHQGVPGLVVCGDLLLLGGDDPTLALGAGHHPVNGFGELPHTDGLLVPAGGQDGCLVHQVGQVRSAEAGRLSGEEVQRHIALQGFALGVHLQDGQAPLHIGQIQHHATVKAPRTQEGRVQDIGAVGGGDHDDVGGGVEPVHLYQYLVEGLLPLVVAPAQACSPVTPHGVYFVDEDDAGGVALGLVKEVPHTGSPHPYKHLHKLGTADGEEGHARLAGHRTGQEGLAGAWGANQEHAPGDACPQGGKPLRILQKLHHLLQFLLRLIHSGHIGEGYRRAVGHKEASAAPPKGESLGGGTLGLPEHEQQEEGEQKQGQEVQDDAEETPQAPTALYRNLHAPLARRHALSGEGLHQAEPFLLAGAEGLPILRLHRQVVPAHLNGGDPPLLGPLNDGANGHLFVAVVGLKHRGDDDHNGNDDEEPYKPVADKACAHPILNLLPSY
ncbi:hypothetical protein HRbin23_01636 [bacterium HR23]|nr:hypothetical protein HRbin23_01636 [bacterium HR23]